MSDNVLKTFVDPGSNPLSEGQSGTSTPRLRLTLKFKEHPVNEIPNSSNTCVKKATSASVKKSRPSPNSKNVSKSTVTINSINNESTYLLNTKISAISDEVSGGNVNVGEKLPNSDSISETCPFVTRMKAFKCRRWKLDSNVQVPILPQGRVFMIPCWVREKIWQENATVSSTNWDSSLKTPLEMSSGCNPVISGKKRKDPIKGTFVCAKDGCHKIFDTKPKWRRHQAVHRRQEERFLVASNPTSSNELLPSETV